MGRLETLFCLPRAVRLAAVPLLAASALSGCAPPENIQTTPTSLLAAETLDEPLDQATIDQTIESLYPEYKNSGFAINYAHRVGVKSGILTLIFNFTDHRYNPAAARAIYDFFEPLADSPRVGEKQVSTFAYRYNLGGNDRLLALAPMAQVKNRATVIVPSGAPLPLWGTAAESKVFTHYANDNAYTFIEASALAQTPLFATMQEWVTVSLAVEACQQTIQIVVLDSQGRQLFSQREDTMGQEVICNSLGRLVVSRLLGIKYDNYKKEMETATFSLPGTGGRKNSFLVFPEKMYNSVPTLGSILG